MCDFKFVERHKAINRDEFWFEIDEYRRDDGAQFLKAHVRFAKFSPSVMKQALADYRLFRQVVKAPLFAVGEEGDPEKWERFVSHFDFKPILDSEVLCTDGVRRRVFLSIGNS